ncbi:hypothetical protein SPRG_00086 [Saprolegnia parasitica CBS 223.65]|uniref:F-box domain-containing protein n=1 Tax=Saprolegnia parasitica (strain CBS 223.65) TaxID=695850 RepID=A0A067D9E1_SAPPC|nr:hypothetical protein SPRG_00086 [Saprolegnia parasitica CBS 223.65]KDO35241.1 hypothetical protein SPRG_00086 [Saprolegnia parasitica CBS 223.65]|eukprot:XP_012193592.1 hypothetical protein SPRG_00086 [Saprolegnia parasitica CBS 223.65]
MTPPDALALPHVVEAIATGLGNQDDLESFLRAVPRSLWTPALTAFLDCNTAAPHSVCANWPRIELRDMDLSPEVLALLAATLPLRPRIQLRCPILDAEQLASLVAAVGPALNSHAVSSLLLQRCPHLRRVVIYVVFILPTGSIELNDLLAVVAHRHVKKMIITLPRAPPRLGYLLAAWLSTAPATKLRLSHVAQMDHDAVIAFCDALQANTTLTKLAMYNAPALGGFHGRTLPVSLKSLDWHARPNTVVDDATLTDLATAVGPTQLERLICSVFGQLAACPAAAPMLAQLQWLTVSGPSADISSFFYCDLSLSTELLMETLATTCVHIATLHIYAPHATRDGASAVFAGTVQSRHLTSLRVSMDLFDVLDVLMELVAAGRHLRTLHLKITFPNEETALLLEANEAKRVLCRALALTQNVPFVVDALPEDTDAFVVDALGPRADRGSRCRLIFT